MSFKTPTLCLLLLVPCGCGGGSGRDDAAEDPDGPGDGTEDTSADGLDGADGPDAAADPDAEAEPDPCAGVTCSGHGQCVVTDGDAQCRCDDGYRAEGLTCVEEGGSVYEVPIVLPGCEGDDVRIIDDNEDWSDINSPDFRVFCVHPGDYRDAGVIRLTADGSSGAERWIRLYDPAAPDDETTHPVRVEDAGRAIISQLQMGEEGDPAGFWIVDRLTVRDGSGVQVYYESHDNVMNRMLVEQCRGHMVTFGSGADGNVLQNSVVRDTEIIPDTDRTCINLAASQTHTRIVSSEIYNCAADGIQFSPNSGPAVVADNDIYLTPALYSDCSGNLTESGLCACAENAIDFKAPRDRLWPQAEEAWAVIVGNRLWGFRNADPACGSTGAPGVAVQVGSGAENAVDFVLIRGNIVMDSEHGIGLGVAEVKYISIVGNLLYDIGISPTDDRIPALSCIGKDYVEVYLNTVVDCPYWFRNGPEADYNDVRCNVAIDSGGRPYGVEWGTESTADYNFFYNTDPYATETPDHSLVFETAGEAAHETYCFQRRKWTGPEEFCIPDGAPTDASPHRLACDPDLGSRTGIGVNDGTGDFFGTWMGL